MRKIQKHKSCIELVSSLESNFVKQKKEKEKEKKKFGCSFLPIKRAGLFPTMKLLWQVLPCNNVSTWSKFRPKWSHSTMMIEIVEKKQKRLICNRIENGKNLNCTQNKGKFAQYINPPISKYHLRNKTCKNLQLSNSKTIQ